LRAGRYVFFLAQKNTGLVVMGIRVIFDLGWVWSDLVSHLWFGFEFGKFRLK